MITSFHCPYRQSTLLQQALAPDKMRIAFLLGAGCPVSVRIPSGEGTKPLIPDIRDLTDIVKDELSKSEDHRGSYTTLMRRFNGGIPTNPTIEDILSHIRALHDIVRDGVIDGLNRAALSALDAAICTTTTKVVGVDLPESTTPYHQLATWIGGIHRAHPIEVFTPNYDLLVEQALEAHKIPYFDGFVGSKQAFFDLTSMENESLPPRWTRLWKVHGSVNWWRTLKDEVVRREGRVSGDRQMIYPSHLKYDQSRRMPYLAMLDRLREFLARGQAVVVTCGYPSSRIVVFDIHGEYSKALADRASVFRVSAEASKNQSALYVPFWALSFEELATLALGKLSDAQSAVVADTIVQLKKESLASQARDGIDATRVTVDSPIPFCLHKLWFELHKREHHTLIPRPGGAADEVDPAYVIGGDGQPVQLGDAMSVTPPLYRTVKTTGPAAERVQLGRDPIGIKQHLAGLASRLRDPRLAFLFNPGEWLPNINGETAKDLDALLEEWIGGPQPITILDLSGIPSSVLNDLIGALLRVLYDAIFWARNLPEGGRERPLLMVLEEAHAYLSKDNSDSAADSVRRIAKEGRKYGVGIMIVSQRPSEIDPTILSQCGTIFAMRLANDADRGHVTSAASDNLKGLFEMLPVLRTGEAIVVGEAVSLPVRTLILPPPLNRRPDSVDPRVVVRRNLDQGQIGYEGPAGWGQPRDPSDYAAMVRQWRKQSPYYEHKPSAAEPDIDKG